MTDKKTEALKLALECIEKLWNIIDDIDTYSDMAKADEKLYRLLVERRQRTRFEETGISADGYTLNGGAITAIREALAEQPAQQHEPVAYLDEGLGAFYWAKDYKKDVGFTPLYTSPPIEATPLANANAGKPWVGLTDEEVDECYYWKDRLWTTDELVRHVEAKLREKNT